MTESCQCSLAGYCERRQREVNSLQHRLCQSGKVEQVDRLLDRQQKQRQAVDKHKRSDLGIAILAAIESRLGRQVRCNACRSKLINLKTPRFADVVTMLNGDLGGAVELRPHPLIEIAAIVERFIPRQSDPFTAEPVLHFGAHLWPTRGTWQWHVELWNRMPSLINGKGFVGIATDGSTDTFETVRQAVHPAIECREFTNDKEGENHTFRWLQEVCPKEQNDILIYCHGKGAQTHTQKMHAVRQWSEAMYQTVVFNHEMIRKRITSGYDVVGSFREFGRTLLMPRFKWHFSGTYFAVRAKHLSGKRVAAKYGGVEAWPGDHFRQYQAWCEFFDNSSHAKLYDDHAWTVEVGPALTEWWRKRNYENV